MRFRYGKLAAVLLLIVFILNAAGCDLVVPRMENDSSQNPLNSNGTEDKKDNTGITKESPPPKVVEPPKKLGKKKIVISAVGDIMAHDNEIKSAYDAKTGVYDFTPFFKDIKPQIEKADLAIGNLETTISGKDKRYTGYPMFNCPETILPALKDVGFDVLTTANNHTLDRKMYGVLKTIENLNKEGIDHTGSFASQEDQDKILIEDVKGIKIAIMAYTYGTNGMEQYVPQDKLPYLVNGIDMNKIKQDIQKAREEEADIVIVSMHWGVEYTRQPNDSQKKMAEEIFHAGADIILGSHPHMLQPMKKKEITTEDGKDKDVFVVYSMGNFISDQRARYKDSGVIVNIEVEKDFDTKEVKIGNVTYVPTWVYRFAQGGKFQYRVLPAGKYASGNGEESLTKAGKQRVQQVWNETTDLMGNETGQALKE